MNNKRNAIYAQSGGPTSVINATACGVIYAIKKSKIIDNLFISINGILGILNNKLILSSKIKNKDLKLLKRTPGGAFGSCRFKLKNNINDFYKIIAVLKKHNIKYFFYNGGNDSQDTINKISKICKKIGYHINCIGIPKTIDNDLLYTDNCPGFGSVAKYISSSVLEARLDLQSIYINSTKVFILEVMGRNTGWIASSACLSDDNINPYYIILFPEIKFNKNQFLKKVVYNVKKYGFCCIIVSEGIENSIHNFYKSNEKDQDAFNHNQLGGISYFIYNVIKKNLNLKCHYAISDYLQRSSFQISSMTDFIQSYQIGKYSVKCSEKKISDVMTTIMRYKNIPYIWYFQYVNLENIANKEKYFPKKFIEKNGFCVSKYGKKYLNPLIIGENNLEYSKKGIPNYFILK